MKDLVVVCLRVQYIFSVTSAEFLSENVVKASRVSMRLSPSDSTVCAALSLLLTPMRANAVFPSGPARGGKVGD